MVGGLLLSVAPVPVGSTRVRQEVGALTRGLNREFAWKNSPAELAPLLLICVEARRQARGVVVFGGRRWLGGAWARSRAWRWCARAPGLISVRDPAVRPVGDVMVDGVIPLG